MTETRVEPTEHLEAIKATIQAYQTQHVSAIKKQIATEELFQY